MICRKKQEQKSINKTEWNFVIVWQILHYTTETEGEIIVLSKNIRLGNVLHDHIMRYLILNYENKRVWTYLDSKWFS